MNIIIKINKTTYGIFQQIFQERGTQKYHRKWNVQDTVQPERTLGQEAVQELQGLHSKRYISYMREWRHCNAVGKGLQGLYET